MYLSTFIRTSKYDLSSIRICLAICILVGLTTSRTAQADNPILIRTNGYSLDSNPANTPSSVRLPESSPANNSGTGNANVDSLSIPLKPSLTSSDDSKTTSQFGSLSGSIGTTIGALVVTLGLFAVMVVVMKRFQQNQQPKSLPGEAFEVIGETEIGPKQKLMVVRCGVQALVIGVSPMGIQNVAQIDDPDEAGQFIAQCRGLGSTAVFNSTLRELEKEPAPRGFVAPENANRSKGKLFLRA